MVDIIINVIFTIIFLIIILFIISWITDLLTPKTDYNPLSKYETHKITNIKGKIFGFTSNNNNNKTKKYVPIFNSRTKCENCKKYNPKDNFKFLDKYSRK